jgi:hypothetical protein
VEINHRIRAAIQEGWHRAALLARMPTTEHPRLGARRSARRKLVARTERYLDNVREIEQRIQKAEKNARRTDGARAIGIRSFDDHAT